MRLIKGVKIMIFNLSTNINVYGTCSLTLKKSDNFKTDKNISQIIDPKLAKK